MAKKKDESAQTTQVTVSRLRKIHEDTYTPTTTIDWNGVQIVVKKQLSLGEMVGFVKGVVDVCFNAETGAYYPEVKYHAIKMMVLQNYANFNMPKKAAEQFTLVNQTEAFELVRQNIDQEQFMQIIDAINMRIEFAKTQYTKQTSGSGATLSDVLEQITTALEGLDEDTVKAFATAFAGDEPPIVPQDEPEQQDQQNDDLPNLVLVDELTK